MKVSWKDLSDERRLAEVVAASADARQRDRYRVVLIAGRGVGDRVKASEIERIFVIVPITKDRVSGTNDDRNPSANSQQADASPSRSQVGDEYGTVETPDPQHHRRRAKHKRRQGGGGE